MFQPELGFPFPRKAERQLVTLRDHLISDVHMSTWLVLLVIVVASPGLRFRVRSLDTFSVHRLHTPIQ